MSFPAGSARVLEVGTKLVEVLGLEGVPGAEPLKVGFVALASVALLVLSFGAALLAKPRGAPPVVGGSVPIIGGFLRFLGVRARPNAAAHAFRRPHPRPPCGARTRLPPPPIARAARRWHRERPPGLAEGAARDRAPPGGAAGGRAVFVCGARATRGRGGRSPPWRRLRGAGGRSRPVR